MSIEFKIMNDVLHLLVDSLVVSMVVAMVAILAAGDNHNQALLVEDISCCFELTPFSTEEL